MDWRAIPTMLSMIPSVLGGVTQRDLERIKAIARRAYPAVPQLGTGELAGWIAAGRKDWLLIDVRSAAEFAVSHLEGAVRAGTAKEIERAVRERRPERTVLYCAVGFRSSRLAHLVQKRGVGALANLEGSIFQWANEGRPLFRGSEPARQVHPFARRWAGLLREGLASDGA